LSRGPKVVVLTGPVGSGKSTLARGLQDEYTATGVSTRQIIQGHSPRATTRRELQRAGDRLDRATEYRWVAESVAELAPDTPLIVVDAARRIEQVEALRAAFPASVVHVHLTAPIAALEQRHVSRRASTGGEPETYADVRKNQTERQIGTLSNDADIVIDTARNRPIDVVVRVAGRLILDGARDERLVDVMVGGQYGSEGKGNVAAYLAPDYDLLVRSGGPNAGHSIMNDGGKHVQHHLPSGTTVCDARLLLTSAAVINVPHLMDEIAQSGAEAGRLVIDGQATVITDEHREQEANLTKTIGSTGQGVGLATAGRITGRDGSCVLAKDVPELEPFIGDGLAVMDEVLRQGGSVFVEGTQGGRLSLHHGPYPYVTSRETNASGILAEAGVAPHRARRVIMVVRTYPIRVANPKNGTSGPLVSEITWEEVATRSGLDLPALVKQEHTTTTRRLRRVGEFDWDLLRTSALLNAPTDIALTFTDQLDHRNTGARRMDQLTDETIRFIEEVESVAGAPVTLISTRFHRRSVIDRRAW
jgi:adenylosuccinate synthase